MRSQSRPNLNRSPRRRRRENVGILSSLLLSRRHRFGKAPFTKCFPFPRKPFRNSAVFKHNYRNFSTAQHFAILFCNQRKCLGTALFTHLDTRCLYSSTNK